MATVTLRIGPADHGRRMTLDEFIEAETEDGWLYELARGIVVVTEVPGIHHGRIVMRISNLFTIYDYLQPGIINYRAAGSDCRLRLPGMVCDRHPDQAIYLLPDPKGRHLWTKWVPQIVVEVVSRRREDRDYIEKREEYLRVGVIEYWILDPRLRRFLVLRRMGDTWMEIEVPIDGVYRTELLPGLEARPAELLGPELPDEDDDENEEAEDDPAE